MKKSIATLLVVLVVAPCWVLAQESAPYPAPATPQHEALKAEVGVWDADISITGPAGETIKSTGVETVTMLGELWSTTTFEYDYLGQPTTGHGVFGYDPDQKRYVGTWFEAGNPYASHMVGEYDKASRTMTWLMKTKDPAGQESDMRIIARLVDDSTRDFQMQAKMEDEFVTVMTIKYTRK